ncbi:MAG: hypothetical protein LBV00_02060 [Propionibacteriaceae bacterium]|nr:hypothetical protein [Propionibacteriaceae bacterium]
MIRMEDTFEAAPAKARAAVERGAAAWDDVVEKVTPLLDTAAKKLAPVADAAWDTARDAKRHAAGFAADTVERMEPGLSMALSKVAPAVDRAQRTVQNDLLPKLVEALHQAAATPGGGQARQLLAQLDQRSGDSVVALQTELVKAHKSSRGKKLATFLAVGAVVGALVVAVRTFLGSREDWAAYEPDEPYVYPDDDYEIDEVLVETDEPVDAGQAEAEAASNDESGSSGAAADGEAGESADASESGKDEAATGYGEGSYVGPNPPEGYTIKGNERSMKYHLPDSSGYGRTTAEVWFNSEEAAQAAGFVRSMR